MEENHPRLVPVWARLETQPATLQVDVLIGVAAGCVEKLDLIVAIAVGSPALLGLGYLSLDNVQQMHDALAAGKIVCVGTRPGNYGTWNIAGSVTTPKLVGEHAYAVVSVNMDTHRIVLRNPWGVDGGKYHYEMVNGALTQLPADGVDDGLVTITFDDFFGSFHHLSIS